MARKAFQVGSTLDETYEIIERIGRGGMGTVMRAKRLSDDEEVAIKYCHLRDLDSRRRFRREVRIMMDIDHPHVVPILDEGLTHKPPYFVMPFADATLATQLEDLKDDEVQVLSVFIEFCEGVQAIHGAGAIHRDLKPDNALMIDGRVVVSDLGLAKKTERDSTILTLTRHVIGTESYLAPEQRMPAGSREADARTDVYQLGKTLYELLTGLDPTLIDTSAIPPGLAHIIRRATRDNPDERYASVGELIDSVDGYRKSLDPNANPLAAFEDVLSRVTDRLRAKEYRKQEVQQLFAIFQLNAIREADDQYVELFDKIPERVLRIGAKALQPELADVLEQYVAALDSIVGGMGFSYADTVASRMQVIFDVDEATPETKALALEAVLLASVRLNRFAAMDSFVSMLGGVSEDADAYPIADMLRRRLREYRGFKNSIPSVKLHPAIRQVRDQLEDA